MSSFISIFAFLFLLGGGATGGGIDFLDLLPTDAYWQAKQVTPSLEQLQRDASNDKPPAAIDLQIKGLQSEDFAVRDKAKKELEAMGPPIIPLLKPAIESKDVEVSSVAAGLVKQFTERAQERAIRRLMAIRTLGERKEQGTLAQLKGLQTSKELFVAEYAQRAVAVIEGRKAESIDLQKALQQDLGLFPRDTGLILQTRGSGQQSLNIDKLLDIVAANPNVDGMGLFGPDLKVLDKPKLRLSITKKALLVLERVGNFRLDGQTLGVSEKVGDDAGWIVIFLRGKYNSAAMYDAIKEMEFGPAATRPAAKPVRVGDIPRIDSGERDPTFLFPSDDLFVFVLGPQEKDRNAAVEAAIAAIKTGKGGIHENAKLVALMKTVNTQAPIWAVGMVNETMKKEKTFEGFETFTVESTQTAESLKFTAKGEGTNAETIATSVTELNNGIQLMQQSMAQQVQQMKGLQPALDFVNSLKVAADGKNATLTGEMKSTILQGVIGQFAPYLLMTLEAEEEAAKRQMVPPVDTPR